MFCFFFITRQDDKKRRSGTVMLDGVFEVSVTYTDTHKKIYTVWITDRINKQTFIN